jgi:membrane glycosyltransferase
MRRDLRWCRGNMQYVELLTTPGLLPTSRFQLVWAISMFIGAPAWTAIIALAALTPHIDDITDFPTGSAATFYVVFLLLYLAPKLAGYADVALTTHGLRRYGGGVRFIASALLEIGASFVIGAVTTLAVTLCLLRLAGGPRGGWSGQKRDVHRLSWRDAISDLWPHLLFGAAVSALALSNSPALLLWSLPLTSGYAIAIPFAVASASPSLGRLFLRAGLCAAPEEFDPPEILREGERSRSERGLPMRA